MHMCIQGRIYAYNASGNVAMTPEPMVFLISQTN